MTQPEVFIIESLSKEDEAAHRYEGQRLADILRLSGKNPKYVYFQSKAEIPHLLALYRQSDYRFLHVSCHASATTLLTTNDEIPYTALGPLFKGYLKLRRVFFSACEVGNELFSECLASTNKGMHSIAAPAEKIYFDHAAAIWGAFYVSAFTNSVDGMTHADISQRLSLLCSLFPVDFHFSTYNPGHDSWRHSLITKQLLASANGKPKGVEGSEVEA